jgi:hypothetical protein
MLSAFDTMNTSTSLVASSMILEEDLHCGQLTQDDAPEAPGPAGAIGVLAPVAREV